MRRIAIIAIAFSCMASVASAQNAQSSPQNPAVKGIHDNNSGTPVAGANSFTMSQARSQIEAKGYTNVMNLKQDGSGVWRGTATKDGTSSSISVDYQGNVN
jgi:hypothetical protein